MQTLSPVGQIPLTMVNDSGRVYRRALCTPPVENSDPAGVALGGNDGQGVCALSADIRLAVADFHTDRLAVDFAFSLVIGQDAPSPAFRLHTLATLQFFSSVAFKRDCGYLLFLH